MADLRADLHRIADRIADALERQLRGSDWVDQKTSPLGRAKHIALVRSGKLPGSKDGRQYLVKRADLDAYLERRRVIVVAAEEDDDAAATRIMHELDARTRERQAREARGERGRRGRRGGG